MGITEILRRIWLFSANKIKSSESFNEQPTQLIVVLNSSFRHIIVTNNLALIILKFWFWKKLKLTSNATCYGQPFSNSKKHWRSSCVIISHKTGFNLSSYWMTSSSTIFLSEKLIFNQWEVNSQFSTNQCWGKPELLQLKPHLFICMRNFINKVGNRRN